MKVVLVAAVSSDGFIENDDYPDPRAWTSAEDQKFLSDMIKQHYLLVMGSKTYEAYKDVRPTNDHLRIVLTSRPKQYEADEIPGVLEFKDYTPEEFYQRYTEEHDSCLLLGGSYVYGQFVKAELVNELYITIEPIALKHGTSLLPGDVQLSGVIDTDRTTVAKLNESGTILRRIVLKK